MPEDELPLKRACGATAMYYRNLELDEDFGENQRRLEIFTAQTRMLGGARIDLIRIPVAVHVVYNTDAQNISDAQIRSQIDVLNEDFRMKNADVASVPNVWSTLVADANIEFELLNDLTIAITRTKTSKTSFGMNESVKFTAQGGHDVYDPDRVLNIWVCNLAGLLGYAQFPGGNALTDGVVINYNAFGRGGSAKPPFDLGRTATHEIGHYLNLRHIWGDTQDCSGDDFVADTPKALKQNYGEPNFPQVTCNNGPNGDMFVNYMDYVDDKAMFMFTKGQVERMAATFLGPRIGFVA